MKDLQITTHGPVAEPEDEDLRAPKRRWAVRMKEVLAAQQLQGTRRFYC
ncbi:hypothetical protein Plhal304r1_c008g0032401 [Plasmopara halstedii]